MTVGPGGGGGVVMAMERVVERVERFSEVLAVARGPWARHWDEAAARRAFQWARYLERFHSHLAGEPALRQALEQRLRERQGQARDPGLPSGCHPLSFDQLSGGVEALRVSLLGNPSASPAAFHRAACCPTSPGDGSGRAGLDLGRSLGAGLRTKAAARLLLEAWDSGSGRHGSVLATQAELLRERIEVELAAEEVEVMMEERLLRPSLSGGEGDGDGVELMLEAGGGPEELALRWLLGEGSALLLSLPGDLLSRAASRHPALAAAYLRALTGWAQGMRYEAGTGRWIHESPERGWERLVRRFGALLEEKEEEEGPPSVREAAEELLMSRRAADGDFDVSGISVWTDLLLALKNI